MKVSLEKIIQKRIGDFDNKVVLNMASGKNSVHVLEEKPG
jgi:hypothetical protein